MLGLFAKPQRKKKSLDISIRCLLGCLARPAPSPMLDMVWSLHLTSLWLCLSTGVIGEEAGQGAGTSRPSTNFDDKIL
jgi:hypothetical protein